MHQRRGGRNVERYVAARGVAGAHSPAARLQRQVSAAFRVIRGRVVGVRRDVHAGRQARRGGAADGHRYRPHRRHIAQINKHPGCSSRSAGGSKGQGMRRRRKAQGDGVKVG